MGLLSTKMILVIKTKGEWNKNIYYFDFLGGFNKIVQFFMFKITFNTKILTLSH